MDLCINVRAPDTCAALSGHQTREQPCEETGHMQCVEGGWESSARMGIRTSGVPDTVCPPAAHLLQGSSCRAALCTDLGAQHRQSRSVRAGTGGQWRRSIRTGSSALGSHHTTPHHTTTQHNTPRQSVSYCFCLFKTHICATHSSSTAHSHWFHAPHQGPHPLDA
eukprot:2295472-Rhodomonas_salina.4